jgi:hypothetical protein
VCYAPETASGRELGGLHPSSAILEPLPGRLLDHVGLGEMSMLVSYLVVSGDEQVARALSRSDAAGCFCGAGPPDESVPRGVSFRACC